MEIDWLSVLERSLALPCFSWRYNSTEATNAAFLLNDLDALHQTLRRASRGRDRAEILSRQMEQQVEWEIRRTSWFGPSAFQFGKEHQGGFVIYLYIYININT